MLVFMRSLEMRPDLLEWFGSAFHAQLLAPFLNMLLREDEVRGGLALESAAQSELVPICSLLNKKKKLDKYGLSTEDNIRKYFYEQKEQRKAELINSQAKVEDATATPEEVTVATDDNTINSVETTSKAEETTVTTEDTAVVILEGSQTTAEEAMVTREESTPAIEMTTTHDTAHEKDVDNKKPVWKLTYANTLPGHSLLWGLFIARAVEPGLCHKSLENPVEGAVVITCPASLEATPATVQNPERPAVEQPQSVSLTNSKTDSKAEYGIFTVSKSDNEEEHEVLPLHKSSNEPQGGEQTKAEAMEVSLVEVNEDELEAEKTQEEDEQKAREVEEVRVAEEEKKKKKKKRTAEEAEEAEVRRQEGLRRDPPLFPNGWLRSSKYDYDEIQVHHYVQDVDMCCQRSIRTLCLVAQLNGCFFVFETDEEGRHWISLHGASSIPKPDPNKKMPQIIECDGGVKVVYVRPPSTLPK